MPLNISKITRARNIYYTDIYLKDDLNVQFSGRGLTGLIRENQSHCKNLFHKILQ